MPNYCCVPFCSNTGGHRFPLHDKEMKERWRVAVRREKWTPSESLVVCSAHFTDDDYEMTDFAWDGSRCLRKWLKKTAVPTVFKWSKPPRETTRAHSERKRKREALQDSCSNTRAAGEIQWKLLYEGDPALPEASMTLVCECDNQYELSTFTEQNCKSEERELVLPGSDTLGRKNTENDTTADPTSTEDEQSKTNDALYDCCTLTDIGKKDDEDTLLEDDVEVSMCTIQPHPHFQACNSSKEAPEMEEPEGASDLINRDIFLLPYICIQRLQDSDKEIHRYTGLETFEKFCRAFWSLGPDVDKLT